VPALAGNEVWLQRGETTVGQVVIGTDPHKRSATVEVVDGQERVLAAGRYGTDTGGYRQMVALARGWPGRVWAVEGAHGTGRPLARRLLADGEAVVDVPAKLAARVRLFDTGGSRKTDAADAHAVAVAALRAPGLRAVAADEELVVLGLLCDRRDQVSRARTQTVNRLHRLLAELVGGGAPRKLTAQRAKRLLATVRPRDAAGRLRRQLAVELLGELVALDRELTQTKARLRGLVRARRSRLTGIFGVGPAGAARVLADVGDVARFADRNRFASWNGTAPLDASSGDRVRHRLSRAGNRRVNHVLYIAAIVQVRHDTPGRAYYRRKLAEGKTPLEALRCLRRRISDAVYRQLVADQAAQGGGQEQEAGPGGQAGARPASSSAAGRTPATGSSEQPRPGPATTTLPPHVGCLQQPRART
jgi:transposase